MNLKRLEEELTCFRPLAETVEALVVKDKTPVTMEQLERWRQTYGRPTRIGVMLEAAVEGERCLALAESQHTRLGVGSAMHGLPPELFAKYIVPERGAEGAEWAAREKEIREWIEGEEGMPVIPKLYEEWLNDEDMFPATRMQTYRREVFMETNPTMQWALSLLEGAGVTEARMLVHNYLTNLNLWFDEGEWAEVEAVAVYVVSEDQAYFWNYINDLMHNWKPRRTWGMGYPYHH